jgi:hypothetical protein
MEGMYLTIPPCTPGFSFPVGSFSLAGQGLEVRHQKDIFLVMSSHRKE